MGELGTGAKKNQICTSGHPFKHAWYTTDNVTTSQDYASNKTKNVEYDHSGMHASTNHSAKDNTGIFFLSSSSNLSSFTLNHHVDHCHHHHVSNQRSKMFESVLWGCMFHQSEAIQQEQEKTNIFTLCEHIYYCVGVPKSVTQNCDEHFWLLFFLHRCDEVTGINIRDKRT